MLSYTGPSADAAAARAYEEIESLLKRRGLLAGTAMPKTSVYWDLLRSGGNGP